MLIIFLIKQYIEKQFDDKIYESIYLLFFYTKYKILLNI